MKRVERKRLDYLDMAKGIGIVLVVLGHSTYAGDSLLTFIASFHMPLFFVISGMLIKYTNEEEKEMGSIVRKKAKTIMLPYLSFSTIYLLIDVIMLLLHMGSRTIVDLIYSFVGTMTLYGISTLWFLPALFMGEISFLFIRKKCSQKITILIGILFAVLTGITHPVFDAKYPLYNNLYYSVAGFPIIWLYRSTVAYIFIMFGYYIKNYLTEKATIQRKELAIALGLFIFGAATAFTNGRVDLHSVIFKNNIYFYLSAFSGSMAVVLLCKNMKTWKPLLLAGSNSLIIMATHLDLKIMIIAIRIATVVSNRFQTIQQYVQWGCVTILVILMETVTVYVINHYFYFLIGKKKIPNRKKFRVVK